MSEELPVPCVVTEAGLSVHRFAGPETADGQTRVRVHISLPGGGISLSIDQWLALGVAVQATAWERPVLPICYDSRCPHKPPPHGRWPDCPAVPRTDAGPCYGPDCDHISHAERDRAGAH